MKEFIFNTNAVSAVFFFVIIVLAYIARKVLFRQLLKWAANTRTKIDDIIIFELRAQIIIWGIILGKMVSSKPSKYGFAFG